MTPAKMRKTVRDAWSALRAVGEVAVPPYTLDECLAASLAVEKDHRRFMARGPFTARYHLTVDDAAKLLLMQTIQGHYTGRGTRSAPCTWRQVLSYRRDIILAKAFCEALEDKGDAMIRAFPDLTFMTIEYHADVCYS